MTEPKRVVVGLMFVVAAASATAGLNVFPKAALLLWCVSAGCTIAAMAVVIGSRRRGAP